MKSLTAVVARFALVFTASILVLTVFGVVAAMLSGAGETIVESARLNALAAVPASVMVAAFMTFFALNRLFTRRWAGYLFMFVACLLVLAGGAAAARFLGGLDMAAFADSDPAAIPGSYRTVAAWFGEVSHEDWIPAVVALCSYALYGSSFWGFTRLFAKRPLMSAFVAPAACMAAVFVHAVFLSGPARALLLYVGIELPGTLPSSLFLGVAGLLLLVVDAVFAHRLKRLDADG